MAHSYQHSTNSNVSGSGPQVLQQQPCNAFGPKGLEKEGVLLTVVRNLLLALLPMAGCLFPVDQPLRSAKRNEIITVITLEQEERNLLESMSLVQQQILSLLL